MLGPLGRGPFDAAVLPEPFLTLAMQRGATRVAILDARRLPAGLPPDDLHGRKDVDAELAARFRNAIQAAAVWANQEKNRRASGAILAKYAPIDAAVIRKMTRNSFSPAAQARAGPALDRRLRRVRRDPGVVLGNRPRAIAGDGMGGVVDSAIVGRDAELAAVDRFLDDVPHGPVALVIEGEAGIGKTTVWLEAVARRGGAGFRVLPGAARGERGAAVVRGARRSRRRRLRRDARRRFRPFRNAPSRRRCCAAKPTRRRTARTTATALVGVLTALAEREPRARRDRRRAVARSGVRGRRSRSRSAGCRPRLGLLLARRSAVGRRAPARARAGASGGAARARRRPARSRSRASPPRHGRGSGSSLPRPLLARLADASGGNPFFALEIARALARRAERHARRRAAAGAAAASRSSWRRASTACPQRRASVVLAAAALSRPTRRVSSSALAPEATSARRSSRRRRRACSSLGARARSASPTRCSPRWSTAPRHRSGAGSCTCGSPTVVADPEERARHLALSTTEPDEDDRGGARAGGRAGARRGARSRPRPSSTRRPRG